MTYENRAACRKRGKYFDFSKRKSENPVNEIIRFRCTGESLTAGRRNRGGVAGKRLAAKKRSGSRRIGWPLYVKLT